MVILTDSLQEKCVVVEVVLDEDDVPLTLIASPLYHDVQCSL